MNREFNVLDTIIENSLNPYGSLYHNQLYSNMARRF